MTGRTGSIARIAAVAAVALGFCFIAQRFIALSTATSGAVSSIANAAAARIALPRLPSPAEVSRLESMSERIDAITDNLANAHTQGFKGRRTEIDEGAKPNVGDLAVDMTQGGLDSTGGSLDAAITGSGFFHVKLFTRAGDGTGYTRNGALFLNNKGDLIVGIGPGYELIPPVNLPPGATNIIITTDGIVQYQPKGGNTALNGGQILLSQFVNPQGLARQGGSIFTETIASGQPIIGAPGENGSGQLQQGFLEESNVVPIKEWVTLIKAEQSLQLNSQAFQLVDRARQSIAALDKQ